MTLYPFCKRGFDLIGASAGLLVLAPLGLLLALLIKLSDGGPALYTQMRVGQHGRRFPMRKFRSMILRADQVGLPVTPADDPRITRIGRLLRRSKLDELPQLWNVLVGQMSFVGPRPEVPRYVDGYTDAQREILRYKPGITDRASLQFRNEEALLRGSPDVESFYLEHCLPKKIALNRHYLERASLPQDLWIILQTLCPYWLGMFAVYGTVLALSLGLTYQLKFDFVVPAEAGASFWRFLPVMILPQMLLLVWRGQLRGLMSYFSIPEMRQTAMAFGSALLLQLGLGLFSRGRLAPSSSIMLIDGMTSFLAICAVRLVARFFRERSGRSRATRETPVSRVGIVGTGALATNLALDLGRSNEAGRRVVAFFDDDPRTWHKRPHDIPVVGMPECILNREWLAELDEIIVALPETAAVRAKEIGELLDGSRVRVSFIPTGPVSRAPLV